MADDQPGDRKAPLPSRGFAVPSRTRFAPELVQVAVPVFLMFIVMAMTWPGRACVTSADADCDRNEYSHVAVVVAVTGLLRGDSPAEL